MRTWQCGVCGRRKPRARMFRYFVRIPVCRNGKTCIDAMLWRSRQIGRKQRGEAHKRPA